MPEQFLERKVHREQIELILTNGTWAPSHGMTQPWRFKVFTGPGLKKLADFLPNLYKIKTPDDQFKESKYLRFRERPMKSSVIILVCMERDPTGKISELEEIEAVACCIQNMALTCTAYGLGSFWSTPKFIYSSEMNDFLGLAPQDKCLGIFYIGYPKNEWPESHRKPLEYVTEWIDE